MIKVGDKLWYVPYEKRDNAKWVTVKSVGRKWITFEGIRPDWLRAAVGTLVVDRDSFGCVGTLYASYAAWEDLAHRKGRWHLLWLYVHRSSNVPDGVTTGQIDAALNALGIGT